MKYRLGILVSMTILVSSCWDDNGNAELKSELERLKQQGEQLRLESESLSEKRSALASRNEDLKKERKELVKTEESLDIIEEYIEELHSAISHYENEIAVWREAHRNSLIGLRAKSMQLTDGRELSDIVIKEVGDDDILIESDGVEMRLKMEELAEAPRTRIVHEKSLSKPLLE